MSFPHKEYITLHGKHTYSTNRTTVEIIGLFERERKSLFSRFSWRNPPFKHTMEVVNYIASEFGYRVISSSFSFDVAAESLHLIMEKSAYKQLSNTLLPKNVSTQSHSIRKFRGRSKGARRQWIPTLFKTADFFRKPKILKRIRFWMNNFI